MSVQSTRGATERQRGLRDRLEQLQVELRETRAALATVEADAQREQEDLRTAAAAAEERLAAASRRLRHLKERHLACGDRREALKKRIQKVRLERDGPVERVGLYNDSSSLNEWGWREPRESTPKWVPFAAWLVLALIVGLLQLCGR